jgi:hypothetical protein
VTRQGCDREMFFEGCEPRREDRSRVRRRPKGLGSATEARETRRTPGSAAGCNKPASSERRKPARWCKTTRSERDRQARRPADRSRGESPQKLAPRWEWTLGSRRWRGGRRTPREEGHESGQGFGRIALERSEDHAGPHITPHRVKARTSRDPRGQAGRPARPRRARGRPTTRSWRRRGRYSTGRIFRRVSVSNLEDPVNLTRAARASAPRYFRST